MYMTKKMYSLHRFVSPIMTVSPHAPTVPGALNECHQYDKLLRFHVTRARSRQLHLKGRILGFQQIKLLRNAGVLSFFCSLQQSGVFFPLNTPPAQHNIIA